MSSISEIIDRNATLAAFALPKADSTFEDDVLAYLRHVGSRRKVLLLAFAPKAAGTFFRQAAIYAIGGALFRMDHAQGGRDATPYLPNILIWYLDKDLPQIVAHAHMQAFQANRNLISAFGIRPVIMLRNVPDMLASFWDMLESDPVARAQGINCIIPDDFLDLSRERKADFMVDIIAPWYASYFASWKAYADEVSQDVRVLQYRNILQSPIDTLHSAVYHAGFVVTRHACEEALARAWSERDMLRYNKGTAGRASGYFSSSQLAEIHRKLSHYPQLKSWMPELTSTSVERREPSGTCTV